MRTALFIFAAILLFGCEKKEDKGRTVYVEVPGIDPPPVTIPDIPRPPETLGFVSFDDFEADVLSDLGSLPQGQLLTTRYLSLCDKLNDETLEPVYRRAAEKAINSLSTEINIEPGIWVGEGTCILRIDLKDYGLTRKKWQIIEKADRLQWESYTTRGDLIKRLTQARRPWIQADNFIEVAHNAGAYELVMELPLTLDEFLNDFLGCNIQNQFDTEDPELFMIGVRNSLIALQKNRSLLFTECRDGAASVTFDTIKGLNNAGRNLTTNPFPVEAGSDRIFEADASEVIGTLPNGLLIMALYADNGLGQFVIETFAPTNIVSDYIRVNIDPTIRNSRSCFSCHASGFLEKDDFIADAIKDNPNFGNQDRQLAKFWFGRNEGAKAAMRQANEKHSIKLQELGINSGDPDPINQLADRVRLEMSAKDVAARLFMKEEDFINELRASAAAQDLAQLLSGGTVNFDELVAAKDQIILDFNLFRNNVGD